MPNFPGYKDHLSNLSERGNPLGWTRILHRQKEVFCKMFYFMRENEMDRNAGMGMNRGWAGIVWDGDMSG